MRHWHVYTDGSSEFVPPFGYIDGFGVYFKTILDLYDPVPPHLGQTNNASEIYACIIALIFFVKCNIVIITDLDHVFVGATGRGLHIEG